MKQPVTFICFKFSSTNLDPAVRVQFHSTTRPSLLLALLVIILPASPWIVPQPKANVWTTLAKALGQNRICLEEFEGLCCLNVSSRAENIHATINKMKDMGNNIKKETDDWLSGLFKGWGLSGWVGSVLKTGYCGYCVTHSGYRYSCCWYRLWLDQAHGL